MKASFVPALALLILLPSLQLPAGTTTKKAGATKIHGDGYKCTSFEDTNFDEQLSTKSTNTTKEDALKYAILASSAYADRNDGGSDLSIVDGTPVARSMNDGQGRVDNWKLLNSDSMTVDANAGTVSSGQRCRELSREEVVKYLGGEDAIKAAGLVVGKDNTLGTTTMVSGKDKDGLSVRFFEESDGTIVLSFRGTADGKDIRDDIKQVAPILPTPQQYKDAAKVLESVLANPDCKDRKIVCTGHSLGGGLVQYAMASNDIGDRVDGYVYNSAGLNGLFTVNSFETDKAQNAAAHITGIRSDGDPISFVGYHLLNAQTMFEVSTEIDSASEHSIKSLIRNMAASMPESELTNKLVGESDRKEAARQLEKRHEDEQKAAAKTAAKNLAGGSTHTGGTTLPYSLKDFLSTQISTNPDVQDAFDTSFDKVRIGLDAVLPANAAQTIADKLEELAKQGVIAAGGAIDKAVQAQIDKLKAEILEQMPGDSSKEQMGKLIDDMIAGIGTGDFSSFGSDAADLGAALAGDYASKLVDGINLPADEKAALKKTISDAVQAYINGGGVGSSIQGNIEQYIYGKIESQFGRDVADAWKNAYNTWQGGNNAWSDIATAAKKTIESWAFQKLEKVIDASLKKLLDNHPVLAEMFKALGIDTGSIMGTIKNIWGVLTGPGDLAAKFKNLAQLAVQGLANMMKSLVHWALDKVQQWLNGFLSKIGKKIGEWVKDRLSNLLQKLHLSQSLIDKAMKAVDAAINAGAKYVASLPSKLEKPIGGLIDKGAKKINEKISGKAAGPQSQQQKKGP